MTAFSQVLTRPTEDDDEETGLMESWKRYLWRERETRLQAVYAVEDALIALGEPVTRTRPKRAHR